MQYTRADFERDLKAPGFPHLQSRERFQAFYEELGKNEASTAQQAYSSRLDFIKPQGRILELGCHCGFNMIHWARQGFECVGVDVSHTLIGVGLGKLMSEPEEVRKRVTFVQGFIEDFEPKDLFDTIVLTETLEHVADPMPVLKTAKRCLSQDGRIYIAVPEVRWGNNSHVRGITKVEMEVLLENTGLAPVEWLHFTNPEETAVIAKHL